MARSLPWADLIIILGIGIAAYIGYVKGLVGTFKGIIGSVVGMIASWLLTPFALAWVEATFGWEHKLAAFLYARLPDSLREAMHSIAETANTLQEIRAAMGELPLPPAMTAYLDKALVMGNQEQLPSAEAWMESLMREIAQHILWAILALLIWWCVALIVSSLLNMLTNSKGLEVISWADGILGLGAYTALTVAVLVVVSGLAYPIMFVSGADNPSGAVYEALLQSRLIPWLASIYRLYVIPWLG